MAGLSQSNEDYLEAILVIGLEQGIVRVKDLAQHMQVKAPSVASAVKRLSEEGLVQHESYGHIELTSRGFELARDIHNRHKLLFRFLHDFLGLDPETAETDACEIEHGLSPQTIDRIIRFLEFMESCPVDEVPRWLLAFRYFVQTGNLPQSCQYMAEYSPVPINLTGGGRKSEAGSRTARPQSSNTTLVDVQVDQQAEVLHIGGEANLKRRLLEMGIVPGTLVSVRNVTLPGDAIDVVVRGYHLSLRTEDAARITVTRVDSNTGS